jgi:AcrR family transcriptional regulator
MSTPRPDPVADLGVFQKTIVEAPELQHLSETARRVLAAAATLFHRQGAVATSVRDITGACGLSPGALYRHFASKDDMLYALVRHGHERLEARVTVALAALDPDADAVARTRTFVHAYVMGHLVSPELAQVVRREYLHLSEPRYREIVRRRRAVRQRLTELLRAGVAAAQFDLLGGADADIRVAVMILDMCSRTSDWYDPKRAASSQRLAETYAAGALRLAGAR